MASASVKWCKRPASSTWLGAICEIDGRRIRVDAEVALEVAQVTQGGPGSAAHVQDPRLAVGCDAPVVRGHVDPAHGERTNVVVDERIAQKALV